MQTDNNKIPKFIISSSPHIRSSLTTDRIMWNVVIALLPACIAGVYFFGFYALAIIAACIVTCVISEGIFLKLRRKSMPVSDGSAVLTGLLLALVLPPRLPIWQAILGSIVAIVIAKQLFGGLGCNIFNPALVGRAFLMAAFPVSLTAWIYPHSYEAVTTATPLALMKFEKVGTSLVDLFIGNTAGSLGETSTIMLLIGGVYLIIFGYMDWRIPLSYVISVVVISTTCWIIDPVKFAQPLFHITAGGFMIGALFMATDPVTSPVTKKGRWIFGIGCGILTMVIRIWGGLPEGVMYAILIMNALSPLIDRHTRPSAFGERNHRV